MIRVLAAVLKEMFKPMEIRIREIETTYLEGAETLADLEWRQRQVDRGLFRAVAG